jgi:homoserine O-acetyltransferase
VTPVFRVSPFTVCSLNTGYNPSAMKSAPTQSIPLVILLCLHLAHAQNAPQQFASLGDFKLQSGQIIRDCRIGYRTLGQLNPARSNAILLTTWLTGTSKPLMSGLGKQLAAADYYVIAIDALGDGVSSSPSNSPLQPRMKFPKFTIADMVATQHQLLTQFLHIDHLKAVMGASMGGVQTFQWMVSYPDFLDQAIAIAGSPRLAPYDLVLWQAESDAITRDPAWKDGEYTEQPASALLAEIGMLVKNTPEKINQDLTRETVSTVLAQERAATSAFDANNRLRQFQAMLALDVSAPFGGSMAAAAATVKAQALIIVTATDHTVTPGPALEFAQLIHAEVLDLQNHCGHHGAECASEKVDQAVQAFLTSPAAAPGPAAPDSNSPRRYPLAAPALPLPAAPTLDSSALESTRESCPQTSDAPPQFPPASWANPAPDIAAALPRPGHTALPCDRK